MGVTGIETLKKQIAEHENTISQLYWYLQLVLGVAKDLDDSVNSLLRINARHPNNPELDTEESRKLRMWKAVIPAASASERYSRIVDGENVGCLEGDETDDEREEFMTRLNWVRESIDKLKTPQ